MYNVLIMFFILFQHRADSFWINWSIQRQQSTPVWYKKKVGCLTPLIRRQGACSMVNMCPYSGIASQCFKKPRAVTAGKKYFRVARVPEESVPEVVCSRCMKCSRGRVFQLPSIPRFLEMIRRAGVLQLPGSRSNPADTLPTSGGS